MSMVISYDAAKSSTVALVFSPGGDVVDDFIELLLGHRQTLHWSASVLASLELTAHAVTDRVHNENIDVWKVSKYLKQDMWASRNEKFDIKTLDLIGSTRSLNTFFVNAAFYSRVCRSALSMLWDIAEMVEPDPMRLPERQKLTIKAAQEDIQRIKSWYGHLEAKNDFIARRAEVHLQNVNAPKTA